MNRAQSNPLPWCGAVEREDRSSPKLSLREETTYVAARRRSCCDSAREMQIVYATVVDLRWRPKKQSNTAQGNR